MKSDTLVPLEDILQLLERISYCEELTVAQLLNRVEADLKSDDKPLENLKALNYFMLHVSKQGSPLTIYEHVLKSCLDLFNFISDKHKTHITLLGSILDGCLSCICPNKREEMFLFTIGFIEFDFKDISSSISTLDNYKLYYASLVLEKCCNQILTFQDNDLAGLIPTSLVSQIISLISRLPLEVSKSILAIVLPKFVMVQSSNTYLQIIWDEIEQSYKKKEPLEKHLFYLCLLSDHFVVLSSTSTSFPLYDKTLFWEIIQHGLINDNNLTRKQALYLLKRYISVLETSELEFETDLFFWSSNRKLKIISFWSQVFILLEVLEEKQTHLIMPAIKSICELLLLCKINEKLCYSWLFCVFYRIICHSSSTLVKWGLNEFCLLRTDLLFSDKKCNLLLSSFFKALNNMVLYNVESSESNLQNCLVKWFVSISESEFSASSFEITLENLVNNSWSPIPLFFVINSLSKVPKAHLWNATSLGFIQKMLLETLKTQCIFIRSAIQCQLLKSITQLSADISTSTLLNILGHFNALESLSRGSGMWRNCVEWLRNSFSLQTGLQLIDLCTDRIFSNGISNISIHSCARGIVIFNDAEILPQSEKLLNLFSSLNEEFNDCEKRVYCCPMKQNKCAEFLICIINELNKSQINTDIDLLKFIELSVNNLLLFVCQKLKRSLHDSIEEVELCEAVLKSILSNSSLLCKAHDGFLTLYKLAFSMLKCVSLTFLQEFLSIKIILHCYNYILSNSLNKDKSETPHTDDIFQLIFMERLFCKGSDEAVFDPGAEHNLKGKLMSEKMKTLWSTFDIYLRYNTEAVSNILVKLPISTLTNCALNGISEDGKQALVPILKSFVVLLPYNDNLDIGIQFIEKSWQACFELRKSELFWLSITEWIAMVYQERITAIKEYHEVMFDKAKKIMEFGEELVGLVDIFINQLNSFHIPVEFSFVISEGLTFGGIARKDKRMEYDVCQYIIDNIKEGTMESFGNWTSPLRNDKEVKLKALNLILKPGDIKYKNDIIKCVVNDLLDYDDALAKNNKRYFNDSITHRRKHRILQALLILEHHIFNNYSPQLEGLEQRLFDWVFRSLQGTNQQPSVRYQLEWLFILLNVHYPVFLNSFWQLFHKAGEERIGSMCSFISIAYHLAAILKDDKFLEDCIENIVPWCMSQNFNIRLYAQVALSKLWDLNSVIAERYNFIRMSQWKTCEQGNMLTNAKKMQSDFYFSVFHPIHHFTLQTLYWDLPRLSNISAEEWIQPDILQKYAHFITDCQAPEHVASLDSYSSPTWISRVSGEEDENDGSSIQKKFIPWKGMFPDSGEALKQTKSGIIVVASLIDKAANLGGLARTCEIFAAKELVIPSLEITKDKEFIGLSMTAEKHLIITEVRPYNLQEYLKVMKTMGYLLIGAEQTTGSVSLAHYSFPRDCILLLGSEREGIPANVIPLLDFCVEIPQLGVIRSLNVHVSGALLLWEYSKQHSLQHLQRSLDIL